MEYTQFTGKTVDEAIETGLQELGLTKENADIRVLEEGKKKLFGSIKARVEIAPKTVETAETAEPVVCAQPVCGDLTDGERTVVFLEGLFKLLKVTACTELVSEGEKVEINVTTTDTNSVIGKHGAMLDAIQTLAGAVANTGREEYKRVVVDCENYRENREATLNKLAENLAQKAVRMKRKIRLEAMNPYERRIIHSALSEHEEVKTVSEGKEPNRYIVIVPNEVEDESLPPMMARNDRRGGGRGHDRRRDNRGGRSSGRGNSGKRGNGGYKKYNRDGGKGSPATGGTTMKKSNDFFGIFLGNSGNNGDEE
ncbi:MAG: protein jag [Clostridiales bacterium]|nr:protein jag [Clostridiales bacterium]